MNLTITQVAVLATTVTARAPAAADIRILVTNGPSVTIAVPGSISGPTGPPGPPGLQGLQGPPGPAATGFHYTQAMAASTWRIAHNLGTIPNVVIVDTSGNRIEGDVHYLDANNVELDFSVPFSGSAYLT